MSLKVGRISFEKYKEKCGLCLYFQQFQIDYSRTRYISEGFEVYNYDGCLLYIVEV